MFLSLIKFCIVIYLTVYKMVLPLRCPENNVLWRGKANDAGCVRGVNGTYHCVLLVTETSEPKLTETCMTPLLINSDEVGCPKIRMINGIPLFSRPFIRCKDSSVRCPGKGHRLYYTDQLYEFPDCIPDERVTTVTYSTVGIITSTEEKDFNVSSSPVHSTTTSKARFDFCPTNFVLADPHVKPIEAVSLMFLLIAVMLLVILLLCPKQFRKSLQRIRDTVSRLRSRKDSPKRRDDASNRQEGSYRGVISVEHVDESTNL